MRRISVALALTVSLFASFAAAQQPTANASPTSEANSPALPPGPIIGGDGNPNYIPIWAKRNYLLSSSIYQSNEGDVGIATTTPAAKLDVNGEVNTAAMYKIGGRTVLAIGSAADDSLFIGVAAGTNNMTGWGIGNLFSGYGAGYSNTFGYDNTFTGTVAGYRNTTGTSNTYVGYYAGYYNTTGYYNTFVGGAAGANNTTGNNNVYIGNLGPASGTESNAIRVGQEGFHTAAYMAGAYGSTSPSGIPVYVNVEGRLGTASSSVRFKEQVRDMGDSTSGLMQLRPVTFLYKPEYANGERTLQYGLIAEEVAKVYPELVAYDKDGQPYSVRYQYLSTMLLNEVQRQYRRAEAEASVITAQEQTIDSQQRQIEDMQQRLSRLETLLGARVDAAQIDTGLRRNIGAQ